jgi:hypothetical protein
MRFQTRIQGCQILFGILGILGILELFSEGKLAWGKNAKPKGLAHLIGMVLEIFG